MHLRYKIDLDLDALIISISIENRDFDQIKKQQYQHILFCSTIFVFKYLFNF